MDSKSAEKLSKVHPVLSQKVANLIAICTQLGLDVRVVQGLRTLEEQNRLFNQPRDGRDNDGDGRVDERDEKVTNARGGQSNHNFGLACDVCPFTGGEPDWDNKQAYQIIGREAKALGLEWGGDWKFVDKPHVQLRGMSVKECLQAYNAGGLQRVWSRMYELLGGAPAQTFIPTADEILEFGDIGDEVTKLQKQLGELNLLHAHEVDGKFGRITKNAVIGFQRQNGLTADGIVGPGTRTKLAAALEANKKIFQNLKPEELDSAAAASTPNSDPSVTDKPAVANQVNVSEKLEQPPTQNAEQITNIDNTAKAVPDNFVPEQKTVEAPPKEDSTATAAKLTIGGFAVPTFIIVIIKTIQGLISQGFVSASDVGNAVTGFISSNQKYVFYLIVAIIALLGLKKLTKQITLWIKMWITSDPNRHDVEVKPQ